jgi:hypothetical protein
MFKKHLDLTTLDKIQSMLLSEAQKIQDHLNHDYEVDVTENLKRIQYLTRAHTALRDYADSVYLKNDSHDD